MNTALEIESKKNVTIADGSGYKAIITIGLSTLTRGITDAALSNTNRDSNGQLMISASSNANLYSIMLSNLKGIGEGRLATISATKKALPCRAGQRCQR